MYRIFLYTVVLVVAISYCRAVGDYGGNSVEEKEPSSGDRSKENQIIDNGGIIPIKESAEVPDREIGLLFRERRDVKKRAKKNKGRRPKEVDPDQYLEKFGYLGKRRPGVQHSPESRKNAIRAFQRMAHLKQTGLLDEETRAKMSAPRCGMPDMVPEDFTPPPGVALDPNNLSPQAYHVPGYKWSKTSLTWKAINYSPDLPQGSQRRAFGNALKYWSDVSTLSFSETSGNPDIEIKFAWGEHGDGAGNAFDGPGNTLAHAYYPESGDTHFDEEETWTEGKDEGVNLEIVAAHEFGHALGLGHSQEPNALMAPFYAGYDANFKLHNDDIQGIQSLYGSRYVPEAVTTRRPPAPTQPGATQAPGSKPEACTTKFDAVMQSYDGKIYVFREKWMFRLNSYYGVEEGFPRLARKFFEAPPYNPGAVVYSWKTRYTYFFKGNRIWKYYGFRKVERKSVRNFPTPIKSAIVTRDGNIILMGTSEYWIFDEARMNVSNSRGRAISSLFPGIPDNIESAVRLNDNYLYFFKGTKYRKYDERRRQVLPGYPKYKAAPWMGRQCDPYGRIIPK